MPRKLFRCLTIVIMAVAAVLAWVPPGTLRPDLGTRIGDRWAHVCWGALVALLMALGWGGARGKGALRLMIVFTLLAGLLEVSQRYVGRGACLSDWGAGVAGAAAAVAIWLLGVWSGLGRAGPQG